MKMGFDEGDVIFDKLDHTYYAGQMVHGRLVFDQGKVKSFRSIYLKMRGYCEIHWTTSHTRRINDRTEHYTKNHNSKETYYEQTIYLIGKKDGECHINPGHHEFPFQCLIPPHCPSSYEHPNGHIRYEFKFVVDRPLRFDQEKVKLVTVIAQRDLNAEPYCKEPIDFEFHESYCCWCMSAGACDIQVSLPQSGFCPGQTIPIEVTCANKSTVKIDSLTFQLKEDITFTAAEEPDKRTENKTLAKIVKGPIPAETTRNWTIEMDIPQMDVYNVESCHFIDIDHEFEVGVATSGCHEDSGSSRRVVIGHIPLREFEDDVPKEIPPNQPVAPLQQYPTAFPVPQYPGANAPFDGGNPPFPGANLPFPGANPPYPGANPPYPGANPPYPGANPPYPGANPPYPGANPPYPSANPPYPGANPPYPAGNSPFQGVNPPYPGANSPFQGANPPYPGGNPQFPGATPPFPGANPPYPGVSPYPVGNSPYAGSPFQDRHQQSPAPSAQAVGFISPGGENKNTASPYPTTPNPFVTASAPVPATPDSEADKSFGNQPAFNPAFNEEKK